MSYNMELEMLKDEFSQKLVRLIRLQEDEKKIIKEITQFALEYKMLFKEFSKIIIDAFLREKYSEPKLRLLNIIDSLMKTIEEYIYYFSDYLYDFMKAAYTKSDINQKKHLFRIIYTWRYLLDSQIFNKIWSHLNLDEMNTYFQENYPTVIKKYDEYNFKMKEKNKLIQQTLIDSNNANSNTNKAKHSDDNLSSISSSSDKFSRSTSRLNMLTKKHFQEESADLEKNEEKQKNIQKFKNKMRESKRKANAKTLPNNNNNNNNNNPNIIHNQPLPDKTNNNPSQQQINQTQIYQNSLQGQQTQIQNTFLQRKRNPSNVSCHSSKSGKRVNTTPYPPMPPTAEQFLPQPNPMAQNLVYPIAANPQYQINFMQIIPNQILPQYSVNNPAAASMMMQLKSTTQCQAEQYLERLIQGSKAEFNPNLNFFSSLSKFFTETFYGSTIIPTLKLGKELFDSRESGEIHKYVYRCLFSNLRNVCAVCGFRFKIHSKLVEHLDIHFNYNFLKYTKNNVLSRKEACNRNSWISNSNIKNEGGYTMNSILYYKNYSDNITNNVNAKGNHTEDINEDFVLPIGKKEICCVYCGDEFKKIFLPKYHYWFYTGVVQVKKKNENENYEDMDISEEEEKEMVLHESCVEEYKKIIKMNSAL